jgi:citrate synthase
MAADRPNSRGLEGVVLDTSSISRVDGERGGLLYRGFEIADLVRNASYEAVVHLLLYGQPPHEDPPSDLGVELAARRRLSGPEQAVVDALPPGLPPLDALRTVLSAGTPGTGGYPPTLEDGLGLVARAPTALAALVRHGRGLAHLEPTPGPGHVENFLGMLTGERPHPRQVRALERYFILLADHGMNPSTLALRVAVSTQSDLVAGAVAALATLKGPAHGGAPARVSDMLDAVGEPARAADWVAGALARKERLYGFGHRAYKVEDPRAVLLRGIAREVAEPSRLALAEAVEAAALSALRSRKPEAPLHTNVEFYAAVVLESVGLDRSLFTPVFALARTAGWAAHALEQASNNRMIRPELEYVGPPAGRRWPLPARP